ncbi:FAD-dependent monooxygenase [Amycolatopsis acidiphila]|uniref:FAD-dependent oxidoreductase n=1 Tax=Amycolatopsis acidiphila TaxID=715473 RepID=A0A558AE09_9PSEU|nr:FAD-dependent oxidoreductase [Amycolatopsis acidiphila]TVT22502.1 FAD-dependent oxidoreductase [Amycolatopsis acidiphila]UIJ58861.1 FAD-dependent monooxygenase [Amycolatopsis acidiphila]GHG72419.1 FAD-dependent oxidoreductase [Amycolatopsis acidiphila]
MREEQVDVLVTGAGLAGLTTAMFLARQGVSTLVVERHPGTSPHPRAAGQSPRTMELYRWAGVDAEVLGVSKRASQGLRITIASSLGGQVFHQLLEDMSEIDLSAAAGLPWGMAGQDVVEPILLARAEKSGAQVRFATRLVSFEQDEAGVTAELDDGEPYRVWARYLVAADGGRSGIRERLGIPVDGIGPIGHSIGVVFDGDLGDRMTPDVTDLYYLQNPRFTGALVNTDVPGRYVFGTDYHPERGEAIDDFTPGRLAELIRLATDLPGLEPEIRWVGAWEMAARVARRFRSGRVFLAGDAAKVTPPTGGMGGNTAVGDGHDLAWKLAAVVRGEAGPGLLDSYEAERRPIAEMVVRTSLHNAKQRMAPELDLTGVGEPVDQTEIALGFRYRSGAVLIEDDDPSPTENPNRPSGRAGFRASHVPVVVDGVPRPMADLLGHGWVLLANGPQWAAAAREVSAEAGVPLACFEAGVDFGDPEELFAARYGLEPGGMSLVRPDGVVAWRSAVAVEDPAGRLRDVLGNLLSR